MADVDIFTVIADPTRREILDQLRGGDHSVGELVELLEVSQPTVSKHLKVLREGGLVSTRADGQRRYYSLNSAPMERVFAWVSTFATDPTPLQRPNNTHPRQAHTTTAPRSTHSTPEISLRRPGATPLRPSAPRQVPPSVQQRTELKPVSSEPSTSRVVPVESADPELVGAHVIEVDSAESTDPNIQQQITRTVGRAAERAADILAHLPKLRRRRDENRDDG